MQARDVHGDLRDGHHRHRRPGGRPPRSIFKATFIPGVLKSEVLVCNGRQFPFTGGTSLGSWATLGTPHKLVLGQPLKVPSPAAFGTASNTVTITKKPPK